MKLAIRRNYVPVLATLLVMIAVFAFGAIRYNDRNFASLYNIVGLFQGGAVVGIAAIGSTMIILSGGIDLSVGAVIAFTSIFVAWLVNPDVGPGLHPLAAIPLALLAGAAFGAGQGSLIHFFELPPFLVTLAGLFFARAMGFVVHEQSLGIHNEFYTQIRAAEVHLSGITYVPVTVWVLLLCYLLAAFALHMTRFGREVYALGGDEASAKLMGINVGKVKIGVYMLGGFFGALAGVIATIDKGSGNPAEFVGYELDCIAAVVIGGTLLTGGVGYIAGTLMGMLILGLIRLIIDNEGTLSTWWTNISVGLLLFLFILLQTALVRLSGSRGR